MLEKIKKHPLLEQVRDVRIVGLLVFGVIALLVTWSTLGAIQTNYELQKQIARIQQQNKIRELENMNLKLKNEYYKTDQYLELIARKQFSRAAPGETMVLVPNSVAMAKTIEIKEETEEKKTERAPHKPTYQRNFEAWMSFLFRRHEG